MLGRVETAGYEAGVKAPVAVQPRVDKSKRAEEVEERLWWRLEVHKWEGGCRLGGGGGGVGGGNERGIPVPGVKRGGKSEWPCGSVSKQASAALIQANISRDYGQIASWERPRRFAGPQDHSVRQKSKQTKRQIDH